MTGNVSYRVHCTLFSSYTALTSTIVCISSAALFASAFVHQPVFIRFFLAWQTCTSTPTTIGTTLTVFFHSYCRARSAARSWNFANFSFSLVWDFGYQTTVISRIWICHSFTSTKYGLFSLTFSIVSMDRSKISVVESASRNTIPCLSFLGTLVCMLWKSAFAMPLTTSCLSLISENWFLSYRVRMWPTVSFSLPHLAQTGCIWLPCTRPS